MIWDEWCLCYFLLQTILFLICGMYISQRKTYRSSYYRRSRCYWYWKPKNDVINLTGSDYSHTSAILTEQTSLIYSHEYEDFCHTSILIRCFEEYFSTLWNLHVTKWKKKKTYLLSILKLRRKTRRNFNA